MSATHTKRTNFDLTPEQDEMLANLRISLSASSIKDTVLRAVQLATLLVDEVRQGNRLFVGRDAAQVGRLLIPDLEAASQSRNWQWLVERPHPWRRQLWIKGRRLLAGVLWLNAQGNNLDAAETAKEWGVPLAAVEEAFAYSEANRELIYAECDEERRRLLARGIDVDLRAPK